MTDLSSTILWESESDWLRVSRTVHKHIPWPWFDSPFDRKLDWTSSVEFPVALSLIDSVENHAMGAFHDAIYRYRKRKRKLDWTNERTIRERLILANWLTRTGSCKQIIESTISPDALYRLFRLFSKLPTTSFIDGNIDFKFSASFHNNVPWLSVIFIFKIFVMVTRS